MPLRLDNARALPTCPQQKQQKNKSAEPRFKIDHVALPMPETRQPERLAPRATSNRNGGRDHLGILGEIKSVHPGEIVGISTTYFRLHKESESDPNVERKKAARALARFLKLHPHNIAQKTEVMVEHFHAATQHKIGGRAKAMVITGSRLEAVRYKQSFDRYIQEKGYAIKSLVAFSGVVTDDKLEDVAYTEEGMNLGIREKELPEVFATQEYQVLLVAEKY